MESLPFRLPEVFEGIVHSEGVLRSEADALILEFQMKDGLFGVIKSDVRKVAIPFYRIEDVVLRSNPFRTDLYIRINSVEGVADIPGYREGRVRLRIPRRYKRDARVMAHEASARVSQSKLDKLERDLEAL